MTFLSDIGDRVLKIASGELDRDLAEQLQLLVNLENDDASPPQSIICSPLFIFVDGYSLRIRTQLTQHLKAAITICCPGDDEREDRVLAALMITGMHFLAVKNKTNAINANVFCSLYDGTPDVDQLKALSKEPEVSERMLNAETWSV